MGFWNFIFGNAFYDESAEELDPKTSSVSNLYSQNGVFLHTDKNSFKISYNGLLAQNGASDITVLVGYGDVNKWQNVTSYNMKNTGNKNFEIDIPPCNNTTLNLAFSDSANNWDNNLGHNYSFFC